jgi:hypothetical protein
MGARVKLTPGNTTHLYKVLLDLSTDETKRPSLTTGNQLLPFTVAGLSLLKKSKEGSSRTVGTLCGSFQRSWVLQGDLFSRVPWMGLSSDKKDNSPCLRYHRFSGCVEHLEYTMKRRRCQTFISIQCSLVCLEY